MELKACYIDRTFCSGARFSFCDECKRMQRENAEQIRKARAPLELSLAHIPTKRDN